MHPVDELFVHVESNALQIASVYVVPLFTYKAVHAVVAATATHEAPTSAD